MTTLAVIVGIIVAAIAIMAALAAGKPDSFTITRQATIAAPPERIFSFFNDFKNWRAWSPWEAMDPALERSYSGAPSGVGAVYAWKGNNKVGEGRMEITSTTPPNRLELALDFIKPFKASNTTEFTIEPQGTQSRVTWVMRGRQPFMGKVMSLFMNMDQLVGRDFERGLANLKAAAEADALTSA